MQVEVGDVAAELAGPRVAEQRVEVGAVDVDLAAGLVHDRAELGDGVLVDAVGRRVGDHDRRQRRRRCSSHCARRSSRSTEPSSAAFTTTTCMPAITADAALVPWADDGIRQTSRSLVAVGAVVAADRQQPGQLALRAGVRLDRDPVVAGRLGQPALELVDQLAVALGVLGRRERVQVGEAGQRDRLHLGGRVELHRAGAERDHAAVEGVVAGRQRAQVAQHLGLAVVGGEHLVGEVRRRRARRSSGSASPRRRPSRSARRRRTPQHRARAVAASCVSPTLMPDVVVVDEPQVHARASRAAATTSAARPGTRARTVSKNVVVHDLDPGRAEQRGRARAAWRWIALGDRPEPLGAVVDGVHRGDHGQQHLGGADVGGRLVAADVLLAGLQREAVRRAALGVDRDPDQAAGQVPLEPGARPT